MKSTTAVATATGTGTESVPNVPTTTASFNDLDVSKMSVKELKAAIIAVGLQQQAVGLAEKSELVQLLRNHK